MTKDNIASRQEEGPLAYENWKAAVNGAPTQGAFEYPLFTDAHIIGEVRNRCSPYQLLNTVPIPPDAEVLVPAIVLREEHHLKYDPNMLAIKKTDVHRYHGGSLSDEVAALVSLCLGIRLKAGAPTREFHLCGDPRGRPIGPRPQVHDPILIKPTRAVPILQQALGQHSLTDAGLLDCLPALSPRGAVALVRAARLYQDAVWVVEFQPELAWVMLVSAVEAAAGHWRTADEPALQRLKASKPKFVKALKEQGGEDLALMVAIEFVDSLGATKKFVDFVLEFLPEPPQGRPPESFQQPWAREDIKKSMQMIYEWRSRALHSGIPFPLPMCMPPSAPQSTGGEEKPLGLSMATRDTVWVSKDTPMLFHIFEYIVRNALLKWWKSMATVEI